MKFLHELSWDAIKSSTLIGLFSITRHIQKLGPSELEKLGLGDRVEFDIKGRDYTLAIDDIPTTEKNKIQNPKAVPSPVTVSVAAITDHDNEVIVPQIKKLELFNARGKEDTFIPDLIAEEMFAAMKHYTGGIIFCERPDDKAKICSFYYEPKLTKLKRPFEFYTYSQESVAFKRID
jgi:hypothetical protein